MPLSAKRFIENHFTKQHLSSEEVGKLANRAAVRSLVLTHFGGNTGNPSQISELTRQIGERYSGPVIFARDLQQFSNGSR